MRDVFPSTGFVLNPVFVFAGFSENMVELLDMNIGLQRNIKLKIMFQFTRLSTYKGSH